MKRILTIIMLLTAVGLTTPTDPVKTFTPDEPQTVEKGYSTNANYLCRYECQHREYDPNYCAVVCGD